MKHSLRYTLLLVLAAWIWGGAFVAQSVGNDLIGPFTFNCVRSLLGALVLVPLIFVFGSRGRTPGGSRTLLKAGLGCGVLLGLASALQQVGLQYASVGKAGFLTALYIVIVPLLGLLFKRSPGKQVWVAVAVALVGLYLLCWSSGGGFGLGDLLLLACSVLFSLHILYIDRVAPLVDGIKLSCLQFLVAGLVCLVPALVLEQPTWQAVASAWVPIGYAGILSSGVAYTIQIVVQKHVEPTLASLAFSLESVFSVLMGWLVLHQALTLRELLGCGLMFLATILAQLPTRQKEPQNQASPAAKS